MKQKRGRHQQGSNLAAKYKMEPETPKIVKRETKTTEPDAGNRLEQVTVTPTDDQIRERAYQRFLERGGQHGHDLDDWYEAVQNLQKK
jgi:hypothetical protein